ncbi:TolB family protein [Nocardioides stalactiti]|uniref:TolB family protein n=1 Tax=Nocardioides stalactiti TaxID=2755356 RepID=UPI0015FF5BB5|nr:hypothetical protein [Nocardioides stalactiti]
MIHDSLRELVEVRGPGVVADADELRGALDDFLAEDEATLGEINLLVDAVRLGALRRVREVIGHGAPAEDAIRQAGDALSRDRGTDDPIRSCWALASLLFAIGVVEASLVRMFRAGLGTVPAPAPPSAPHGRAPEPAPAPAAPPAPAPERPAALAAPASVPHRPTVPVEVPATGGTHPRGPVPPTGVERRTGRAGVALLVVLVALILGGLVAAGVILLGADDGDDGSTTADDPTSEGPGRRSEPRPLVPDTAMLVAYEIDDEAAVFEVDVASGVSKQLSPDGVDARLPTISPDRRSMTYVDFTEAAKGEPGVLMLMDLESGETRRVFDAAGPCAHALRPGWSLDGSRVAAICQDDEGDPLGIYVTSADGSGDPRLVVEDTLVRGAPTWVSRREFVYGRYSDDGEVLGLRLIDADAGGQAVEVPTPPGYQISYADWSPEAGQLLFLVTEPGAEEEIGSIWTMNANGTGQKLLAEGEFLHPVWSVDGRSIGVTWYDDSGSEVLAYLDVDDPSTVVVVPDPPAGEAGIPVWATR